MVEGTSGSGGGGDVFASGMIERASERRNLQAKLTQPTVRCDDRNNQLMVLRGLRSARNEWKGWGDG